MSTRDVAKLPTPEDELGIGVQHGTCANPRCDEQFTRTPGPGRRKDFHSQDCRRAAERDLRRTLARLEHHERQAEQLRARASAYLRTIAEEQSSTGPTPAERQLAYDTMLEFRGAVRFLRNNEDPYAVDIVRLFEAVAPVLLSSAYPTEG